MPNIHDNEATLTSYAEALLELADARGQTDAVAADVAGVAEVVNADPAFAKYLADPTVKRHEREQTLATVFEGKINGLLLAFLQVLSSKNHLAHFPGIAGAFKKLLDVRSGKVAVEVTVAKELSAGELEDVRQQISQKLNKDAQITQKIDESIIGGLVLKIGDKLIDGSVKSQLDSIKSRMIAAV
jgi:F-type H+-transporting ATPase subunit delta